MNDNDDNNIPLTQGKTPASILLNSSYISLGSPPEVGERFIRFLLSNTRTLKSLHRILLFFISSSEDDRPISGDSTDENLNRKILSQNREEVSLEIDAFDLIQFDPELGHMLLRYPSTLLPLLEDAASEAYAELSERWALMKKKNSVTEPQQEQQPQRGPQKIHARLIHLPPHSEFCKPSVSTLSASDVGKVVQISGTVVRASPVRMVEIGRAYRCRAKGCNHAFVMYADFEQENNSLQTPTICPMSVMQEGGHAACQGTSFEAIGGGGMHTDYQEIKIQESAARLDIGFIPRSLMVKLTHDLVDRCQPGDEVFIVGSLIAQWSPSLAMNLDMQCRVALRAHSIKVVNDTTHDWKHGLEDGNTKERFRNEFQQFWTEEDAVKRPIAARNFICRAVCPNLWGMLVIKLGLLLTLVGGTSVSDLDLNHPEADGAASSQADVQLDDDDEEDDEPDQFLVSGMEPKNHSDTTATIAAKSPNSHNMKSGQSIQSRRRAQSHILLVGDPGTGKSQFLRFAAALSPRSVLTTGVGTTSAGLTCAAVRESSNNEFTLEAGALVLADRGVCCIDEFGCIRPDDRNNIHEAMEQQTISVAKAGIVCKLNSRATVVAVMNPKGSLYISEESLEKNTNVASPLLSRFDCIFVLLDDSSDLERDDKIARFLLDHSITGSGFSSSSYTNKDTNNPYHWSMDKLRSYIAVIKEQFQPILTPEAAKLLQRHYRKCRAMQHCSSVTITVRFLESLIRLSQAHARLMYRNVVTIQDAVAVILLMECSAATSGGLNADFVNDPEDYLFRPPMQTDFPGDDVADEEFLRHQYIVLRRYDMLEYHNHPNNNNDDGCNTTDHPSSTIESDPNFNHGGALQNAYNDAVQPPPESNRKVDCWGRTHISPMTTQKSPNTPSSSSTRQSKRPRIWNEWPRSNSIVRDDIYNET